MLKKIHLITGYVFFGLFLGTGAYMLFNFPDLYKGQEEVRMMYRSTHIYLLLAALLNIQAAGSLPPVNRTVPKLAFSVASILLIISPIILFLAFIYEPPSYLIDRPFSFFGILFLVVSVILGNLSRAKWLFRDAT
jgi:hypothetical protein